MRVKKRVYPLSGHVIPHRKRKSKITLIICLTSVPLKEKREGKRGRERERGHGGMDRAEGEE